MNELIRIAHDSILAPVGLEFEDIDRLLGQLTGSHIDTADIYFQSSRLQSWILEDGIIKEGSFSIEQGAGVRVISGEKTGFAYSDELELSALQQAVQAARAIARSGGEGRVRISEVPVEHRLYGSGDPVASLPDDRKIDLLHRVDQVARDLDPRVRQVTASLVATHAMILVATDTGALAADVRPLVRLGVSVVAEEGSETAARSMPGTRPGWP